MYVAFYIGREGFVQAIERASRLGKYLNIWMHILELKLKRNWEMCSYFVSTVMLCVHQPLKIEKQVIFMYSFYADDGGLVASVLSGCIHGVWVCSHFPPDRQPWQDPATWDYGRPGQSFWMGMGHCRLELEWDAIHVFYSAWRSSGAGNLPSLRSELMSISLTGKYSHCGIWKRLLRLPHMKSEDCVTLTRCNCLSLHCNPATPGNLLTQGKYTADTEN